MQVPLLDVNAQNLPLENELREAFLRVLRSGQFILGPEVEAFEKSIAAWLGAKNAIAVSSGTDALIVALLALDIGPGHEVLCPSFTFFATAGAIARVGATPVFVDSCPVCFNINTQAALHKVTANTKAIIPVHLFGQSADMEGVQRLAEKCNLPVIEDAAQALGARTRDKFCGTIGDFGTFSFFPSKNLGGFGDGGLITTNDPALAQKARLIRVHGMHPRYHHHIIGGNFRFDPLQAALLSVKFPHYPQYTQNRQNNAQTYFNRLLESPKIVQASLTDCQCQKSPQVSSTDEQTASPVIILPCEAPHNTHIWNQFTLRVLHNKRDALKNFLSERQIASEIYYPIPLHQQACFNQLPPHSLTSLSVADQLAKEVLSIPIYPELSSDQLNLVADTILEFVNLG